MISPSSGADAGKPKRSNLLLPWEIVVAPSRAFERIAVLPEWMVAYGVILALYLAAAVLQYPALLHVMELAAKTTNEAKMTPADVLQGLLLGTSVWPLVRIMLVAVAITVFAGTRDVKNFAAYPAFLSLATNVAVISAIGELLEDAALRLHPVASFTDFKSLDMALPITLTFLAAKGNTGQAIFLSHFGIFDTWATIVLAFGLSRLAKIALVPALVFVFTLDLAFAFLI